MGDQKYANSVPLDTLLISLQRNAILMALIFKMNTRVFAHFPIFTLKLVLNVFHAMYRIVCSVTKAL